MAKPKLSAAQPTIKEIGNQWLAELDPVCKPSTMVKYGNQLESHIIPECVTIPQEKKDIRVLTFSEEMSLLGYLKIHPNLTSLGILICLFTGIRIGELCALMWSDISLDEQELYIRRTMQRLQNRDKKAEHKTYIHID